MFKEVGNNVGSYARDLNESYLSGPVKRGDPIQIALGVPMAAVSLVMEGPDQLWAGAVDTRLEHPNAIMGRTRRDIGDLVDHAVHLRPLKTIADVFRLTGSVPLDAGDALIGFRSNAVRSQIDYTLAA